VVSVLRSLRYLGSKKIVSRSLRWVCSNLKCALKKRYHEHRLQRLLKTLATTVITRASAGWLKMLSGPVNNHVVNLLIIDRCEIAAVYIAMMQWLHRTDSD
jgi:hypothetical protein